VKQNYHISNKDSDFSHIIKKAIILLEVWGFEVKLGWLNSVNK
jgi:hypothetical protein